MVVEVWAAVREGNPARKIHHHKSPHPCSRASPVPDITFDDCQCQHQQTNNNNNPKRGNHKKRINPSPHAFQLPSGYTFEILQNHKHRIPWTLKPITPSSTASKPSHLPESARHPDGDTRPKPRLDAPSYTCTDWFAMSVLVLDGRKVHC